jgi:hypothetical protein
MGAAALLFGILGVAGCASASGGAAASGPSPLNVTAVPTVQIINDRPTPMQVTLFGNGQSQFLGTVPVSDTLKSAIPETLLATSREIRVISSPLGGGRARTSDPVYVDASDPVIQWTLESTGAPVPMVLSGN